MKKIIVTGCNGQLGRALNKIYQDSREYECVNTDVAELDITNIDDVNRLVSEVKPYAIINCAAHTNVNGCETDVYHYVDCRKCTDFGSHCNHCDFAAGTSACT